jgi:hypothetical protein
MEATKQQGFTAASPPSFSRMLGATIDQWSAISVFSVTMTKRQGWALASGSCWRHWCPVVR